MNIVIVDDDVTFAKKIESFVKTVCQKHEITGFVERIQNPLEILRNNVIFDYDVVLLDIEMPQMNGLDVAKQLNSLKSARVTPYIVFVTSQDHLVFEALNCFPYSFIRKSSLEDLEMCLLYIQKMLSPTYVVKAGKIPLTIRLSDFVYAEKQGNYIKIFTVDNVYQERSTVDNVLSTIGRNGFFKAHSGALVNAAHIADISNDCVILTNGKRIPISRTYRRTFKEQFRDWMVKV